MLGSIVQRGKKFSVKVYVGIDPATKKRRYKWHGGFESRREADAFRATLAHHPAFSAGVGVYGNARLRTGDFLDSWLKDHASTRQLESKTEERYKQFIRVHLKPAFGHIPLSRLSPKAIQELYSNLLGKGLSRTTVRHIANLLHLAMDTAVRRGLIARNPVDQTDPPSRTPTTYQTLTPAQLRNFLDDAKETAPLIIWAMYLTKAMTGMRFGELLGLRETDLDLGNGVLNVQQTLKHPGPHAEFGKPKTQKSRRAVTLPIEVVDALKKVRTWKLEQKLRLGPKFRDYGLVFCGPSGKPLHRNNIRYRDFHPRLERLGLPRIRPHDIRHTHGTQLIAAGIDPRTVADRLGHSSPAFTMVTYVHGVPESQRRAAEAATQLLLTAKEVSR